MNYFLIFTIVLLVFVTAGCGRINQSVKKENNTNFIQTFEKNITLSNKEELKWIEIYFYNDHSIKAQPELVDIKSEPEEVQQLFIKLTEGEEEDISLDEVAILNSKIMIYQIFYERELKVTKSKYFLLLKQADEYYSHELNDNINHHYEEYSKGNNKSIIDLVGMDGWKKIHFSN